MFFANYNPRKYIKKVQELFCQAKKLFSAEIGKMTECHFWANVMLRQPCVRASGPLLLKSSRVLGCFIHQLFKCYIFYFHVHSDGRCIFELSAHDETNLITKRSVCKYRKVASSRPVYYSKVQGPGPKVTVHKDQIFPS